MWNKHPVKLKYINKHRIRIPNPNPKGKRKEVWGGVCHLCNQEKIISEIQVDHVDGGDYTLTKVDDIQTFIENIILVTEKDLQFLCKECNATMTYAKRHGLDVSEAFCVKHAIRIVASEEETENFFNNRPELVKPKYKKDLREYITKQLIKETK